MTQNGCEDSITKIGYIKIYPQPIAEFSYSPEFPNIITPNNDGINDYFAIKNLNTNINYEDPDCSI